MKPQVDRGLDAEEKTNKMHVIDMKPVLLTGQECSKEGASLSRIVINTYSTKSL